VVPRLLYPSPQYILTLHHSRNEKHLEYDSPLFLGSLVLRQCWQCATTLPPFPRISPLEVIRSRFSREVPSLPSFGPLSFQLTPAFESNSPLLPVSPLPHSFLSGKIYSSPIIFFCNCPSTMPPAPPLTETEIFQTVDLPRSGAPFLEE